MDSSTLIDVLRQFVSWIGVTPVLREVLGSDITPFGSWYFPEIAMLAA